MKKLIAIILILLVPFLIGAQTTYLTGPGTTYPQGININGLVGYWKLGKNYSGNTILGNYSSNPPNMTKSGTTIVDDPEYGPVRYFDGIDDYCTQEVTASGSGDTYYMATVDDGAFFWDPNADFSLYLSALSDKRYMLMATDGSGLKAGGYIGGTGSGETLGGELIVNGDMEGGFTAGLADGWSSPRGNVADNTIDYHGGGHSQQITNPAGNTGVITQVQLLSGELITLVFWAKKYKGTGGVCSDAQGADFPTEVITEVDWTEHIIYFIEDTNNLSLAFYANINAVNDTNGILFDDVSIKQVTSPPANESVILYSDKTGSTQSLAWEEDDFDANDIVSYEIRRTDLNFGDSVTIFVWVKLDADIISDSLSHHIMNRKNVVTAALALVKEDNNKYKFQVRLVGSEATARDIYSDAVATTGWVFLAGTYDGDKAKLYVNAILQSDFDDTNGSLSTYEYDGFEIGRRTDINDFYYKGVISDASIFNRALSAAEIKHIYDHSRFVTTVR